MKARRWLKLLTVGAAAAALGLVGCAGDSSDDGTPAADTTAPTVSATVAGGTYTSAQTVSLAATDDTDTAPVIYYTTDASIPTETSTMFATPIAINDETILKFFAVDADGNASAVVTEGYVIAAAGSTEQAWAASGHGDIAGEAFRHWDEDGVVSTSCAKCHTPDGLADYALDGTVDNDAGLPLGIECTGCHVDTTTFAIIGEDNATYPAMDPVAFPSGEAKSLFGPSNLCLTCHQGRNSKDDVDAAIAANPGGPYTFINIHYFPAAATYFGSEVRGGYEYDGMSYRARNTFPSHPDGLKDCVGCHMRGTDDHTFSPELADCTGCHAGTSFETLGGSPGQNQLDLEELSSALLTEIQSYASTTIGTAIAYNSSAYPYFFVDTNGNGVADAGEANYGNRYTLFDEALLKAAYNYQMDLKDPCDYIHNGTYAKQLLYDSIVDLGGTPPAVPVPGRSSLAALAAPVKQTGEFHQSGHAAAGGEPFRHWDEDGEVSASCAKCHSTSGFIDFAADGTVDAAANLGTVVGCAACHSMLDLYTDASTRFDTAMAGDALFDVAFPSGDTASLFNSSNICMVCHQGRNSTVDVDAEIGASAGPYSFVNIHYYAAAATVFGSEVQGGYEYAGLSYRSRNTFPSHPDDLKDCVGCHMRGSELDHTFEPQAADCTGCHGGTSFETLAGSPMTNLADIETLSDALLAEVQTYATGTVGTDIVYDPAGYPYFFVDTNGNGVADPDEANFGNRYTLFDATLLRAAYNYQVAQKDPNGYLHNGTYIKQLLYDSIGDLGGTLPAVAVPGRTSVASLTAPARQSAEWQLTGHADYAGEPFRHWDEDGEVSTSCAKCHSATGFLDYVADGTVDAAAPLGTMVNCVTCHTSANLFNDDQTRYEAAVLGDPLNAVEFPSGVTQSLLDDSNMCMACHQGRESGVSVQAAIDAADVHSFINRHYFAAAAILFGSDVTAAYEYAGKTYKGQNLYTAAHGALVTCSGCHLRGNEADHNFKPELADCSGCHSGITTFEELGAPFGGTHLDYDGDNGGAADSEGYQGEIDGMNEALYAAIQAYATGTVGTAIVYEPTAYPYWFVDTNANGAVDAGEAIFPNRYQVFDDKLLAAAFNYHAAQDPCGDMHNYQYVLQTVYDSTEDLDAAAVAGLTRP